jgi:two-component system, LuxR family, sensor kinase FixL
MGPVNNSSSRAALPRLLPPPGSNGQAHGQADGPSKPAVAVFDFTPDGYLVTDSSGIIQEANGSAGDLLQQRPEALIGKPLALYAVKAQRREFYTLLSRLRTLPGALRDWPLQVRSVQMAAAVTVAVTVAPRVRANADIELHWLLRDLTKTVLLEQALQKEKAFADSLLDAAQAYILLLDTQGCIVRSNPYVLVSAGYTQAELFGQHWGILLAAKDRHTARDVVWQSGGLGLSKSFRGELLSKTSQGRMVQWSAKALLRNSHTDAAVLVLGHDITELQAAQQQALQAERLAAIGQVTAALAHESRNLLQRSQSCLERLSWRVQDEPEALDLVKRIQEAQRGLTRLFQDVQMCAAPLRLEWAPCQLGELWRETWREVCSLFPDQQAELREDIGETDLWCTADRFRLGQVFRNILENAFAACAAPVHIAIRCREGNLAGRPALHVSVRDNGPGLNAEQRQRIFEPFYTTKARGSGLGMAISSRILEAHGGQIAVSHEDLPGTEIILLLPRSQT